MLNFKSIFEFFFKSFVVARDIQMIERLKQDGFENVLLIKRSWLYGLASLFWLIPLLIVGGVNIFLMLKHFDGSGFWVTLSILLGLNIVWTIYSCIAYILDYRTSYGEHAKTSTSSELLPYLAEADRSFIRCFNQLQFNFVFFCGIIVIYFVHIFFIATDFEVFFAFLDVVCIAFQLGVIRRLIHLMIDLEMDFNVVVKGKLFFVNQNGVYSDINTLDADKIKNIKSSYPGFLASFFHYGTIEVLTEGDELMGHNVMQFVDRPERTVEQMNALLN